MYTRCPDCHTTHPLNASLLVQGGGRYRCGKCQKVCNALDALFDEWPAAGKKPPIAGDLPVLGMAIDLEQAGKSRLTPDDAALSGEPDETSAEQWRSRSSWGRLTWLVLAVAVAILVIFEWSDFQQKPLLEQPEVQSWLIRLGIQDPPPKQVFRDLDQIHLVSRELKSHPVQQNTLRLTATIVNRAAQSQPYPGLEVILLDAGGEEVSRRRFEPPDYLAEGTPKNTGMTPEAYLPLVLDLVDPGSEAVGFELNFQ